ncbi:ABC transporter [Musa troglodytarum]|uniref:ABC transporter n=1 Tax=Musa troglodytarum TaxID=320322 RepID=A0A9E7EGA8_9LILI|nr:ABC transporter [Musa troglodytarum]
MESSSSYSSHGAASFFTQANVLHRKNLTFQKRNLKTNIGIVAFPIFLCAVIILIQNVVEAEMNKDMHQCGCQGGVCGIQYSSLDQFDACPISSPFEWPALHQVPRPESRAVTSDHPTPRACPMSLASSGAESVSEFFLRIEPLGFPQQFVYFHSWTDTSMGNTVHGACFCL